MLFRPLVAVCSLLPLAHSSVVPRNLYARQDPPAVSVIGHGSVPLEAPPPPPEYYSTPCLTDEWGNPLPTGDAGVIETVIDGTTYFNGPVTVTVTVGTDGETIDAPPSTSSTSFFVVPTTTQTYSSSTSTLRSSSSTTSTSSSSSVSASETPSLPLLNARAAKSLNDQYDAGAFTSLTACEDSQRSCINGVFNVCKPLNNKLAYLPQFCSDVSDSGEPRNVCAAVPFIDGREGTETGCFTQSEIQGRFTKAGLAEGAPNGASVGNTGSAASKRMKAEFWSAIVGVVFVMGGVTFS